MPTPTRRHRGPQTAGLLALAALVAATGGGCRRLRAHRAGRARVVTARAPAPPAAPLFAAGVTAPAVLTAWIGRGAMLSPFTTAVDGWLAVVIPAGTVRWVAAARDGRAAMRESLSPCRYDASRHAASWTLPTRIGLDGLGHACCVHDGDDQAPAGAYCADLSAAAPRWRRARTPVPAIGAGSGDGAIALFATDVWCTRDGGATQSATFRGDSEQPLAVASCSARGHAAAGGGARSLGAIRQQTLRTARDGGSLALLDGAPRGEPIDVRALDDGTMRALVLTREGPRFVQLGPDGRVTTVALYGNAGRAIGGWGLGTSVVASPGEIRAVDARTGAASVRTLGGELSTVAAATRVGRSLVAVTRDGQMLELGTD